MNSYLIGELYQDLDSVFPIVSTILLCVALLDFSRFFITSRGGEHIVRAVMASASAITLLGLHKGMKILSTNGEAYPKGIIQEPNIILFIFVIAGGVFLLFAFFVQRRLEDQNSNNIAQGVMGGRLAQLGNIFDSIVNGPWIPRVFALFLLAMAAKIFLQLTVTFVDSLLDPK